MEFQEGEFQEGQEEGICDIHNKAFSSWISSLRILYGYKKALADTGVILQEAIAMYKRFQFDLSRELWVWVKIVNKRERK
ncbi:MAG: hypothetical protein ACTSQN_11085 [Candidatus Heimdallarchaeota archaeon]